MAESSKLHMLLQIGGILFYVQVICISILWGNIKWKSGEGFAIRTEMYCSGVEYSTFVEDRVSVFKYHIKYCAAEFILRYTPLWKSNRNFFSTKFFYHSFFVLSSSFYTWYMWGGQYQFCNFLLDFDHWLYLSDILKKVTGSKPDVALVWFMQWAKMEFEHGEKYRYWCIVRV